MHCVLSTWVGEMSHVPSVSTEMVPATWLHLVHEKSSSQLPITQAQLMRPDIDRNAFCAVDDLA